MSTRPCAHLTTKRYAHNAQHCTPSVTRRCFTPASNSIRLAKINSNLQQWNTGVTDILHHSHHILRIKLAKTTSNSPTSTRLVQVSAASSTTQLKLPALLYSTYAVPQCLLCMMSLLHNAPQWHAWRKPCVHWCCAARISEGFIAGRSAFQPRASAFLEGPHSSAAFLRLHCW